MDVRLGEIGAMSHYLKGFRRRKPVVDPDATVAYIKCVAIIVLSLLYGAHLLFSFYNSLWLIFNDLVIGWSFGNFLLENKEALNNIS